MLEPSGKCSTVVETVVSDALELPELSLKLLELPLELPELSLELPPELPELSEPPLEPPEEPVAGIRSVWRY